MTVNSSLVKLGLVVTVAVMLTVALVGCSKNTSGTGMSSTTGASSTAAPSATSTPSSSTGSSSSSTVPSATANARFVGHWHVHGAVMDVAPTTATIVVSLGRCAAGSAAGCSETDTLAVTSGDDAHLTLTVTAVNYSSNQASSVPNPNTGPSTAVGDSMQLTWQATGLLKAALLHGFPGWQGGNPYWCGAGVSQSDAQKCGA
jgi:hypothetical protein